MCLINLINGVANSFDSCNQILPTPRQAPSCVDVQEMVIEKLTFKGDYKFFTSAFLNLQAKPACPLPPTLPSFVHQAASVEIRHISHLLATKTPELIEIPHPSNIATARVHPADAARIFIGKQAIVKPVGGSTSRLWSFSKWQYPISRPALWPSQMSPALPVAS
jgi:hypothetical protein